ncbi:DMT family transporter [Desulfovibrio gilichinskyi]|uniref:Threonine/homoserine efflux transporter RhtA n=1 Tax=Desulfovibrio gilichinskyi TaxID=1519643 RepID=A0A1X7DF50_9BACT|nr:DMT family transporter [Desulfovibrio gilichinskyi]SMF14498.1 Threonine/homoserine efflux transporter RhtA [Desulfovibrio gilichinskyi]
MNTDQQKSVSLDSSNIFPILALLGAVLLWGSAFAAMKHMVGTMNPWTVMWLRTGIATLVLAPFTSRFSGHVKKGKDRKALALLAFLMPCLYFLFESHALTYTSATQAGLISASLPLMVAVGAGFCFKEKTTLIGWAGLAVSIAGVTILSLTGSPSSGATDPALGNMLELAAMVSAAGYMLLVKRLSANYGPLTLTAVQNAAGAIFFLPGLYLLIRDGLGPDPLNMLIIAAYLGAFVTLGAFGLYNVGMSKLPAGKASAFINLVPAIAAFFGWILLGETLTPLQMIASLIIFAGVWLAQYGDKMGKKKIALLNLKKNPA